MPSPCIYESELISSWCLLSFYLFFLYIFGFLFSSFSILCWSSKTQKQKIVYVFVVDGSHYQKYNNKSGLYVSFEWNHTVAMKQPNYWMTLRKIAKTKQQIQSHFLSICNGTKKHRKILLKWIYFTWTNYNHYKHGVIVA